MKKPLVAIIMGSDSDYEVMSEGTKILDQFSVPYDIQVMSAHRTPEVVREFITNAARNGLKVIIAGAGGAAHLAGVAAAHTTLPVIGVPLDATPLKGFDSLLSTVQMPPGIPVATVAVGKFGAINAAVLAVEMLALADPGLQEKLADYRKKLAENVKQKNENLRNKT